MLRLSDVEDLRLASTSAPDLHPAIGHHPQSISFLQAATRQP